MTDEYDDDAEDQESEESEGQEKASEGIDPKKLAKLQNENRSLRARLRRSEVEAKHGKEIAGLIPDELPLNKWEEWADRAAETFKVERAEPETEGKATEEESQEAPSETETKLAALSEGSPDGTPSQKFWTGPELIRARRAGDLSEDQVKQIVTQGRLRGKADEDPGVTLH